METDVVLIKKGEEKSKITKQGRLYRFMLKSHTIEAIISEIDPHNESKWFQHNGKEMHLVLQGEIEYTVGEKTYTLSEGDIQWHKSMLKHHARNSSGRKVVYITIGTPPTFMSSML